MHFISFPKAALIFCCVLLVFSFACQEDPDTSRQNSPEIRPHVAKLLMEAEQAMIERDFLSAVRNCSSIIEGKPDIALAYFIRGKALMAVEQFEEAKVDFEKVLTLEPDHPSIRFNLGHNAFEREQFPEALAYYNDEKSRIMPGDPPEKKRAILMQIGRCHKRLGEIDEAMTAFQEVVALDKNYDEVYNDIGEIYQEDGDFEEALKFKQKALTLAPDNSYYNYFVGVLLYKLDRYQEAIGYLRKTAEEKPWLPGIYYNVGRCMIALGKVDEGQAYLSKVDSVRSRASKLSLAAYNARVNDTARMWSIYGSMLYDDKRYDEAYAAYEKAHFLAPAEESIGQALSNLGKLLERDEP